MRKKLLFIVVIIFEVVSAYKLLGSFPTSQSRMLGFTATLFFTQLLLILWVRYLIHQPEEVQKEIMFSVISNRLINTSLYDFLHGRYTKTERFYALHGESIVSLAILFFVAFFVGMSYFAGKGSFIPELKAAFSFGLLPYYAGFCLSSLTIITNAIIYNKKNNVVGPLRLEVMIKAIQALFITFFYTVNPIIAFFLVILTSFMRLKGRQSSES